MVRSLVTSRLPKPIAIVVSVLLALFWVSFVPVGAAYAVDVGGFEIEGNQVDDPQAGIDWETAVADPENPVVADEIGNADTTTFGGGQSEGDGPAGWSSNTTGTAAGKSDIGNVLVYDQEVGDDTYAYFAFDRAGDTGTGRYYIELNQKPNSTDVRPDRTIGDVRIIISALGSDNLEVQAVQQWDGSAWIAAPAIGDAIVVAVNGDGDRRTDDSIVDYFGSPNAVDGRIPENQFVEFAVNLSSFGLTRCPVTGFSTINLRSQEGGENGDTSSIKDLATGPIDIDSDCGSALITKTGTLPGSDGVLGTGDDTTGSVGGALFSISPYPLPWSGPGAAPASLTVFDDSTANSDAAPGNVDDEDDTAGSVLVTGIIPGTYSVTEVAPPSGYLLGAPAAADLVVPEGDEGSVSFDNDLGNVDFTKGYQGGLVGTGAVFTLTRTHEYVFAANGTYTLQPLTTTTSFDVTDATSASATARDRDADAGEIHVEGLLTGQYSLVEKSPPIGYTPNPLNAIQMFTVGPEAAKASATFITQPPTPTFNNLRVLYPASIEKVDPVDGSKQNDAVFDVYQETNAIAGLQVPGDTLVGTDSLGVDGIYEVGGLSWDVQYYWFERTPPSGHSAPADIGRRTFPFMISSSGVQTPDYRGDDAVENPAPVLTTDATHDATGPVVDNPAMLPDADISDTGTVRWLVPATVDPATGSYGSVTFSLYGPGDDDCSDSAVFTSTNPLTFSSLENGYVTATATSGTFTATQPGTYRWTISYSGDNNGNIAVDESACNLPDENSVVIKARPGLSTEASAGGDIDESGSQLLTDSATLLAPFADPGDAGWGQVTFRLFRFDDAESVDCSGGLPVGGTQVGSDVVITVEEIGGVPMAVMAQGEGVTVTEVGLYQWVAMYGGDDVNEPTGWIGCDDPFEQTELTPRETELTTLADPQGAGAFTLGEGEVTIRDTVTIDGATETAAGTVLFELFGPYSNAEVAALGDDCSGAALLSSTPLTVSDADDATPGIQVVFETEHTFTEAGWYVWFAEWTPSDGNNIGDADVCSSTDERFEVDQAEPTLTTDAMTSVILGTGGTASIMDGATLDDYAFLTGAGSVEFYLSGPDTGFAEEGFECLPTDDDEFWTLVATIDDITEAVDEDPEEPGIQVSSGLVPVDEAGSYLWQAVFTGDANNESATHDCPDLVNEVTDVLKRQPTIETVASDDVDVLLGVEAPLTDTATLADATEDATGTITFALYGPFDEVGDEGECPDVSPLLTREVDVDGNGIYSSGAPFLVNDAEIDPEHYFWVATYSGDDDNLGADHPCWQDEETTTVTEVPPGLEKEADKTLAQPGETIDYTVTAENTGDVAIPADDDEGLVTDTLPLHTTYVAGTAQVDGLDSEPDITMDGDQQVLSWDLVFAAGQERVITYQVVVDDDVPQGIELTNDVTFFGLSRDTTVETPEGDLSISKVVVPASGTNVSPGETLTYTLTVTSSGTLNQRDVVVTDYVPGNDPDADRTDSLESTYVEDSAGCLPPDSEATCDVTEPGDDGLITWELGDMAAGSSRQVTFQVTVDPVDGVGEIGLVKNAGYVDSSDSEEKESNQVENPVVIAPGLSGDLGVTKSVSPLGPAQVGDTLTYTLNVAATGNLTQNNVVVSDFVPGYDPARPTSLKTTFVPGSATCVGAGTCNVSYDPATHMVTWGLGDMAGGTTRQVTFAVTIDSVGAGQAGDVINAGTVTSVQTPPKQSNEVRTPVAVVLGSRFAAQPAPAAVLARTGAEIAAAIWLSGAMLLLGAGMVVVTRRRRKE